MFLVIIRIAFILQHVQVLLPLVPDIHPDMVLVTQHLILKNIGNKFPITNIVFV